eukprot:NODE_37_length_35953_cov_1.028037.p3 type:complete len:553 gc:universal NODE_37_length_35953_cov_1.028037:798-2456(+)
MLYYIAVDSPKRNTRNEEISKKPVEWRILENSEELEQTFQDYAKDRSSNTKVIIEDQLFYADIANFEIRSIYWEGPVFEMRRGLWFSENGSKYLPCEEKLSAQLEQGFKKFFDQLADINSSEEYKKYPLFGPYLGQYVLYASRSLAYIVMDGITSKVAQALVGKFSKQEVWGTRYLRDIENIPKEKKPASSRKMSAKGAPKINVRKGKTPDHLIFVVHGIGQKLFTRDGIYTFASDVSDLREKMDITMTDLNVVDRYMMLPIQWREIVEFGVNPEPILNTKEKMSDIGLSSSIDCEGVLQMKSNETCLPSIDEIIIPTNPYRNIIKDVCLDILLYMTDKHRISMLQTVAEELNRVHNLFLKNFPDFKGSISMIGHSLGTLILFDLLSMEKEEFLKFEIPPLVFCPLTLFFLGSPVSMIRLLNGEIIRPIHTEDKKEGVKRLRIKYLYNIYHMFDPIAHRMEPIISRKFPKEPVQVFKQIIIQEEDAFLAEFNPLRKRVDFVLQSGYLESAYQYLSAISQHSNYWTNSEITSFLARELVEIHKFENELPINKV